MMVYQHHERYDGQGYPVGLPGVEIHPSARVTTVADVFHALTSVRSYRQPMSTAQACGFLADHAGKMFDPDMAKCWIDKMKAGRAGLSGSAASRKRRRSAARSRPMTANRVFTNAAGCCSLGAAGIAS